MKYRDGDRVVDAEQWHPGKAVAGVSTAGDVPIAETAQGKEAIEDGDWIVTDADGKRYRYRAHMFDKYFKPDKEN